MARVSQEFFCDPCGGGCGGFFVVRLNMAINTIVELICPGCAHEHLRAIRDGKIYESGRDAFKATEQIRPTKAAFSKTPFTKAMRESQRKSRDHVPLSGAELNEYRERWLSVAARERGEDTD